MSSICVCDFTDNNLTFLEMNRLANELVAFALKSHKGIIFSFPINKNGKRVNERIFGANIKQSFEVTDTFLNTNCEFVEDFFDEVLQVDVFDNKETKELFFKTFGFLEDLLKIVFRHGVLKVNLYISNDNANKESDFVRKKTTIKNFLNCFYNCLFHENNLEEYEFNSVKFIISNN